MRPTYHSVCLGLTSLLACGPSQDAYGAHAEDLVARDTAEAARAGETRGDAPAVGTASAAVDSTTLADLGCARGGETAAIHVRFACDEITVLTCKDLSNVVLDLSDGSRRRVEGLRGHENTFVVSDDFAGASIVGVWVKAGSNHSGDGPGYGERFDAPDDHCVAPPADDCSDLDEFCPDVEPPAPPSNPPCTNVDEFCPDGEPPTRNPPTPVDPDIFF